MESDAVRVALSLCSCCVGFCILFFGGGRRG